ncbi:hypothetical protein EVAR_70677_1 [Eumeta japonica]|uniref:MADF domain-containing protein n=1 Tax=Eumeta variegata TaxID=151549 RepID=A0A4C1S9U6_EUMVA|nr:hypothetical protein EVAR_70677_1 [Eumeta japonica]
MDIQAETLITLVQERPVLWDKTEEVYKDKNLKLAAWREVCLILKPNFDELEVKERKQYAPTKDGMVSISDITVDPSSSLRSPPIVAISLTFELSEITYLSAEDLSSFYGKQKSQTC